MILGIIFAIVTGLSWVWLAVIISYATRKEMNIPFIQFCSALVGLGVSLLVLGGMMFFPKEIGTVSSQNKIITALALFATGFLNFFMLIIMGKAMKTGPHGIIWSIIQAGMIFPFLMGILFFHVEATISNILGMAVLIISLIFSGLGKKNALNANRDGKIWFLLTLFALVLNGLNQAAGNLPSYFIGGEEIGSVYRTMFAQIGGLTAYICGGITTKTLCVPTLRPGEWKKILFFVFSLQVVGLLSCYLFFYNALDLLVKAKVGAVGYPIMVGSCVTGFFLYTTIFLKERTSLCQKTGFILGILGIVMLCL